MSTQHLVEDFKLNAWQEQFKELLNALLDTISNRFVLYWDREMQCGLSTLLPTTEWDYVHDCTEDGFPFETKDKILVIDFDENQDTSIFDHLRFIDARCIVVFKRKHLGAKLNPEVRLQYTPELPVEHLVIRTEPVPDAQRELHVEAVNQTTEVKHTVDLFQKAENDEPVMYQFRSRTLRLPDADWGTWTECSKLCYEDCLTEPVTDACQYQVRKLYAGSQITLKHKPNLPCRQDFCYCDSHVSLQIVSGGASKEGYLGRVTLKIDDEYVDYIRVEGSNCPIPKR